MNCIPYSMAVLLLGLLLSCSHTSPVSSPSPPPPPNTSWPLSDAQVRSLLSKKIFFGHQSVGANIVQGIADLMATDSRLTLILVSSSDPASVEGAAFVEAAIGANGDPVSKDTAFAAIVNNSFGVQGGVAMYKYCFVDFSDQ